jgi:hypothetical protein
MRKPMSWLAIAVLLLAGAASAQVVTFEFQGTVTNTTYMASSGSTVTGHFSWDTAAPTSDPIPSYQYSVYTEPYTFGIWAKVGPHTIRSDQLQVSVYNDLGGNAEDMITVTGSAPVVDGTTFSSGYFSIGLASGWGKTKVFRDTSLQQHLNLMRFDAEGLNYAQLWDGSPNGLLLDIKLESIRRVPTR